MRGIKLQVGDHGADFGLADELAIHHRLAAVPPHQLALGDLLHVIFDSVSRHDRAAELGLVDGQEIDRAERLVAGNKSYGRTDAARARGAPATCG